MKIGGGLLSDQSGIPYIAGLLGLRLHSADNTHHQTIGWLLANLYINVIRKMWIWNRDSKESNIGWCGQNIKDEKLQYAEYTE